MAASRPEEGRGQAGGGGARLEEGRGQAGGGAGPAGRAHPAPFTAVSFPHSQPSPGVQAGVTQAGRGR